MDIGQENRRLRQLVEQQARTLDAIMAVSPDPIFMSDGNGRIVYAGSTALELLGLPSGEVVGRRWQDLGLPSDIMAPFQAHREEVGRTGIPGKGETPFPTASGMRHFEYTLTPVPDESGGFPFVITNARDITARKQVEERLRKLNRALLVTRKCTKTIVGATQEAELLQQACDIIVFEGGYLFAWTGFAEHDSGRSVVPVAAAGFADGYLETLRLSWSEEKEHGRGPAGKAVRDGKPVIVRDIRTDTLLAPWRDEALRRGYASLIALPLSAGGEILGVLIIYAADPDAFDADEASLLGELAEEIAHGLRALRGNEARERLEGELAQARKMEAVGRLAGGIAHDFNNLLTAINGYAALLLRGLGEGDPLRLQAQAISQSGERAAALTRQLLAFSRKQVLHPQTIDLNGVLERMVDILQGLTGDDVDCVVRFAPEPCPVLADPAQIEQVVMNLAVNAREAMPQGGRFSIATLNVRPGDGNSPEFPPGLPPGPAVLLLVSDTGGGMTEETRSHAFEPFFTTLDAGKGAGLGLATVYGIVRQSGGVIRIDSEKGRGSTFEIFFPAAGKPDAGERPADPPRVAPPGVAGGAETILVVDDSETVRGLVCEILTQAGYVVVGVGDPEEAIDQCARLGQSVDLLVTDVMMPGMTGVELGARLSKRHPKLKVIYISGYTGETVIDEGLLEESCAFLQKPFSPDTLLATVRSVLDAG
jgi:PAS domain S-box-containing protein